MSDLFANRLSLDVDVWWGRDARVVSALRSFLSVRGKIVFELAGKEGGGEAKCHQRWDNRNLGIRPFDWLIGFFVRFYFITIMYSDPCGPPEYSYQAAMESSQHSLLSSFPWEVGTKQTNIITRTLPYCQVHTYLLRIGTYRYRTRFWGAFVRTRI